MADRNYYGLYRAQAKIVVDPAGRNRIRGLVPAVTGTILSPWMLPCRAPGSSDLPVTNEAIWVAYENGDVEHPVWLGVLT